MAYEDLHREECPNCHTLREDWVDDENFPLEEPLYAAVVRHCYGCEEITKIRDKIPSQLKGSYVVLIPSSNLEESDFEIYDPMQDPAERQRLADQAANKSGSLAG